MSNTLHTRIELRLPENRGQVIHNLLQTLDQLPFEKPISYTLTSKSPQNITNHSDIIGHGLLEMSVPSITFRYESNGELFMILFDNEITLSFKEPMSETTGILAVEKLRILAQQFILRNSGAEIKPGTAEFVEMNYAQSPRTQFVGGLIWLQYWDAREVQDQGGFAALLACPTIQCEKIGNGLLVIAGESALDVLTPEGQQRLITATKSLPPPNFT